jgi:hypothetical protein
LRTGRRQADAAALAVAGFLAMMAPLQLEPQSVPRQVIAGARGAIAAAGTGAAARTGTVHGGPVTNVQVPSVPAYCTLRTRHRTHDRSTALRANARRAVVAAVQFCLFFFLQAPAALHAFSPVQLSDHRPLNWRALSRAQRCIA